MDVCTSRQARCRLFWFAVLLLFWAMPEVMAQEHKERHFHGQLRANGRFISTQKDFPPQHKNINGVTYYRIEEDQDLRERRDRMRALTEQSDEVRALLGRRFTFIGIVPLANKGNELDPRNKVIFFSHSLNQTVEALIEDHTLLSTSTIEAGEYQPPLSQTETNEAVDIARDFWSSQDGGRVANMRGFSILAYEPTGSAFFDTRVAYVTFHRSIEGRPEYVAYVDLTNRTVIRSWEE